MKHNAEPGTNSIDREYFHHTVRTVKCHDGRHINAHGHILSRPFLLLTLNAETFKDHLEGFTRGTSGRDANLEGIRRLELSRTSLNPFLQIVRIKANNAVSLSSDGNPNAFLRRLFLIRQGSQRPVGHATGNTRRHAHASAVAFQATEHPVAFILSNHNARLVIGCRHIALDFHQYVKVALKLVPVKVGTIRHGISIPTKDIRSLGGSEDNLGADFVDAVFWLVRPVLEGVLPDGAVRVQGRLVRDTVFQVGLDHVCGCDLLFLLVVLLVVFWWFATFLFVVLAAFFLFFLFGFLTFADFRGVLPFAQGFTAVRRHGGRFATFLFVVLAFALLFLFGFLTLHAFAVRPHGGCLAATHTKLGGGGGL
jgi:hypothetical protein